MTRVALALLDDPDGTVGSLDFEPNYEEGMANMGISLQVFLIARNSFISHVETQLTMIKVIAGQKTESSEEAKKRLTQNSNK